MFLKKRLSIALAMAIATTITGCSHQFDIDEETRRADLMPDQQKAMQAARGTTFVREIKTEDLAGQRPVFLTAQNKSLRSVLQETLPGYAIIPRGNVNLNDPIDVSAQGMPLNDFIQYIEGTRDLTIKIDGRRVFVSAFDTRQWNLAAFATTRGVESLVTSKQSRGAKAGDDDGGSTDSTTGSSIAVSLSEDEWSTIMEGARRIIGAPKPDDTLASVAEAMSGNSDSSNGGATRLIDGSMMSGLNFGGPSAQTMAPTMPGERQPFVEGIRSVGIVTAGGSPQQMRVLGEYLEKAVADATKIVNVQVKAYEVVLQNGKQKAIDWDAISLGRISGNAFDFGIQNASQITTGGGFWNMSGTYEGDRGEAKAFIKFLETFGRVELQDQPNLTVRNGVPAQIYAGEEMTYISDIEQSTDENGVVTVTPKLARLKVGVTLAVTVRVLDDERLLVDVTPVISNLSQYDTISLADYEFQTPRIALKEFSTQLICNSGESVHLGGLITEKLEKAIEQLPWQNAATKQLLNPLFQNLNNQLERRELVLVVTPTLIEGAR